MVEWAMDSCRLGCLAAVYAQPFWLLLQLWLCAGYALLRLLNLHVQTEEEKSLLAGPDGTVGHLFSSSVLAGPSLMDAALPVLAVYIANLLPAPLQELLPDSLRSRGSWGLTRTQDHFGLIYFCCLLPLCLFVSQRIGKVAAALLVHICSSRPSNRNRARHAPRSGSTNAPAAKVAGWNSSNSSNVSTGTGGSSSNSSTRSNSGRSNNNSNSSSRSNSTAGDATYESNQQPYQHQQQQQQQLQRHNERNGRPFSCCLSCMQYLGVCTAIQLTMSSLFLSVAAWAAFHPVCLLAASVLFQIVFSPF